LVTQVTSSAAIRANVARMQEAFIKAEREQPVRALIDRLLDPRSADRPVSQRGWLSAPTGA